MLHTLCECLAYNIALRLDCCYEHGLLAYTDLELLGGGEDYFGRSTHNSSST